MAWTVVKALLTIDYLIDGMENLLEEAF